MCSITPYSQISQRPKICSYCSHFADWRGEIINWSYKKWYSSSSRIKCRGGFTCVRGIALSQRSAHSAHSIRVLHNIIKLYSILKLCSVWWRVDQLFCVLLLTWENVLNNREFQIFRMITEKYYKALQKLKEKWQIFHWYRRFLVKIVSLSLSMLWTAS